ncbi:DUF1080 domain-containing protein [bacterium]|nr:DUF1080 domain-containing protein [bacterium]
MISHKNRGFTLIELVMVVIIILTMATVGVIKYDEADRKVRVTQCLVNRVAIEDAERRYYYTKDEPCLNISKLVKEGFLDKMPTCAGGGQYIWISTSTLSSSYPMVGCSVHYWYFWEGDSNSETELFSSDFDNMDYLTPLRGDWVIQDGALRPTGKGEEHRLVFGSLGWTDYTVEMEATLDEGMGYGIYYRSDGKANITGYCFQYDLGDAYSFLVRKVFNGREQSPFQRVSMPEGFSIYSQSHTISIGVDGNSHQISVDGQIIMEFDDDSFSSGATGFRSWGHSEVSFDEVRVY